MISFYIICYQETMGSSDPPTQCALLGGDSESPFTFTLCSLGQENFIQVSSSLCYIEKIPLAESHKSLVLTCQNIMIGNMCCQSSGSGEKEWLLKFSLPHLYSVKNLTAT